MKGKEMVGEKLKLVEWHPSSQIICYEAFVSLENYAWNTTKYNEQLEKSDY